MLYQAGLIILGVLIGLYFGSIVGRSCGYRKGLDDGHGMAGLGNLDDPEYVRAQCLGILERLAESHDEGVPVCSAVKETDAEKLSRLRKEFDQKVRELTPFERLASGVPVWVKGGER